MYTLTILIQQNTGQPSENDQAKRQINVTQNRKGEVKFIFAGDMLLYIEKPNTQPKIFQS